MPTVTQGWGGGGQMVGGLKSSGMGAEHASLHLLLGTHWSLLGGTLGDAAW